MSVPRIYHNETIALNTTITLGVQATHHLVHALRLRTGETIQLFNGRGGEFTATLIAITKKGATVQVEAYQDHDRESPLFIHLGQSILRSEKMDWVIQKAVELGVNNITPLLTEFSTIKLKVDRLEKRLRHWEAIIISACEQCGRNKIPILQTPKSLTHWVTEEPNHLRLMLHYPANKPFHDLPKETTAVNLLIGPEGGFSSKEVIFAEQNGFQKIQLGARILRTETAPLAAITLAQHRWGDM